MTLELWLRYEKYNWFVFDPSKEEKYDKNSKFNQAAAQRLAEESHQQK